MLPWLFYDQKGRFLLLPKFSKSNDSGVKLSLRGKSNTGKVAFFLTLFLQVQKWAIYETSSQKNDCQKGFVKRDFFCQNDFFPHFKECCKKRNKIDLFLSNSD